MKNLNTLVTLALAFSFSIATSQTAPNKQWDARFGGSSTDALTSLQQTDDGGYIMGGSSKSVISGDKTQASQGIDDYWIVKTDATGVKQWDARFGGSGVDALRSLQQTDDGGYILSGYSESGISGDKSQASQGFTDYWIVKTDGSGVKQWDATFGGSEYDLLLSLQQTADGGYILGGYSYSGISGDKTQASQGFTDYWIVKTDGSGVKQWDATFGGNSEDNFYSLQQTADGGYILGGYSYSGFSGDKTQSSQGGYDYWIVKTDAGATTCPLPTSLYVTDLTTTSAKLNWDPIPGAIGYRVKYKAVGSSQWTLIPSTDNQETITGLLPNTQYWWLVKTICNKEPIIASDSASSAKFKTPLLRLEDEMVIPENFFTELYPNPVQNQLTIKLATPVSDVTIRVYDLQGKMIDLSTSIQNTQAQINTTALPSGFYTLQIIINKTGLSKVLKFVKQE